MLLEVGLLFMAQLRSIPHDLAFLEEACHLGGLTNTCREHNVPQLTRHEEQAIFTLNFEFSGMEAEILFQIEQTWGVVISPDDIKLTIPHPVHYQTLLPADMTVREALDRFRPDWHREQDFGFDFRRPFQARDQPYVFRIDCKCNAPDVFIRVPHDDRP